MKILRIFAGPNGSGKSTIIKKENPSSLGIYLNADEIEKLLRRNKEFSFSKINISVNDKELKSFFRQSTLFKKFGSAELLSMISVAENRLLISENSFIDSRIAQMIVDFSISKFLKDGVSFSFETVMSHQSKIDILKAARNEGYEVFLYFITTDDVAINIQRVAQRKSSGGHDVAVLNIVARYQRSLSLLFDALHQSTIAYLYDNSGDHAQLIAKVYGGKRIQMKISNDEKPNWFITYLEEKIISK